MQSDESMGQRQPQPKRRKLGQVFGGLPIRTSKNMRARCFGYLRASIADPPKRLPILCTASYTQPALFRTALPRRIQQGLNRTFQTKRVSLYVDRFFWKRNIKRLVFSAIMWFQQGRHRFQDGPQIDSLHVQLQMPDFQTR